MKDAKDIIVRLRADYAEVFSSPRMCNMIGAILYFMDDGADEFIRYFFEEENRENFEEYYHWAFLGMNHEEILRRDKTSFNALLENMLCYLRMDETHFHPDRKYAAKMLLKMNVEEASRLDQPFDFDLWEHALLIDIQPPRASYYLSTDHSVGNRILIQQDDFSLLNGANFKEKQKLFCGSSDNMHKSCRFLQTIRIFYEYRDWNEISVVRNVMNIVTQLKNDYRAIYEELNRRKRRRYKY